MNPFKCCVRDNGEAFVTFADDVPDGLREAVYDAHAGRMPDDWVFLECKDAYDACEFGELAADDADALHQYADGRVDVYTKALYQWAADFCTSNLYSDAESEASDCGLPEETEERLRVIQYCAILRIAATIRDAYWAAKDEDEENATDESEGA